MQKLVIVGIALLWLNGCQEPRYTQSRSVYIAIRTPLLRYADMGFVETGKNGVRIQLYANGTAQTALELTTTQVCSGRFACMPKETFNARFLSVSYPRDLLEKILRAQPVMGEKNLKRTSRGFTQRITRKGKYAIDYRVLGKRVIFRDTINKILIRVVEQ